MSASAAARGEREIVCRRCHGTGVEVDERAIGLLMRAGRERCELSLRAAARKLGISAAYLSDLELGRRHWSEKRQLAARRLYGIAN